MFYIWRIEKLKNDLATGYLPAASGLRYIVAFGIVASVEPVLLSPQGASPYNLIDYLAASATLLVFVFGTIACYRANQAEQGHDFVARYLSLAWVLGIRWVVIVFVPVVIVVLAIQDLLGEIREETSVLEASSVIVVLGAFFWRLTHHFLDVARSTSNSTFNEEGSGR